MEKILNKFNYLIEHSEPEAVRKLDEHLGRLRLDDPDKMIFKLSCSWEEGRVGITFFLASAVYPEDESVDLTAKINRLLFFLSIKNLADLEYCLDAACKPSSDEIYLHNTPTIEIEKDFWSVSFYFERKMATQT